jgi:transcriptional regulator with PAS, ATPase and Fis domain
MLAPLVFNDEVLGIIYVDDRKRSNRFSEDDLKFLTSLGNLTAMAIANLRLRQQLVEENRHLRSVLGDDDIVGESREIKKILSQIGKVAGHTTTVLITGESGTGKEMVAKAIHKASERADKPFVAVNCAAIPEGLIEAELFGFAQDSGIANASTKGKPGKFELAHTGTLFLDEVGDMPLATQVKILRALQERKIERLGGTTSTPVNIRIVTATNKSLEQSVRDGSFREDLFFRLRVFAIEVPPLRQRGDDIVLLAEQYLKRKTGGRATLADRTKEILSQYSWPGNVRELFNCLERAAILGDGKTIRPTDLPREVRGPGAAVGTQVLSLSQMEKRHITDVLEKTGGNKSQAAKILDISRDTLYQKIKQFGLE